jgi:hypothetical protein
VAGEIDLGIRLRELLYRRDLIAGPVRDALLANVNDSARQPHRLALARPAINMLIDTWSVGALIDDARRRWARGPDPRALPVMVRAAEIVAVVLGWPRTVDGRWPMPDKEWFKSNAGDGPHNVVLRGPRDGGWAAAVSLRASTATVEPMDLPNVVEIGGDEIVARRDEVLAKLASGDAVAVRFNSPPTHDDAAVTARQEFREVGSAQRAFELYGSAGLMAPSAPELDDLLVSAPAGVSGPRLVAVADGLLLPVMGDNGKIDKVGCLVWDGAYHPATVVPVAVQILHLLDGSMTAAAVAKRLRLPPKSVAHTIGQLIRMGAVSSR